MYKRIAAVLAALGLAAAPFLAAGALPLPGLEAPLPAVGGGGVYIFETISLVAAEPAARERRSRVG